METTGQPIYAETPRGVESSFVLPYGFWKGQQHYESAFEKISPKRMGYQ
jgi:hypothetical protein